MAERVTKVRITAVVNEYLEGMEKVAKATRETGTEAEKLAQKEQAFNRLGTSAMAMGAVITAGVGVAVSKFGEFDQAMSYVAATGQDARDSLDGLRQAALDAGADTVFSATESANAIEEMAKAGLDAETILSGGLTGALDLAAAGGLGVADAAGIAATALKTFNLEGSDMAHVADLLAAGAGKAMGDVSDLAQALNQSSMVANATGLSIEETTAALSAFASQGLLGSDAGTSFKSMLQSLTPTSAKARETMQELGISAYDAQGNFVGLANFAGNLKNGLKDLTVEQQQAALKTIFGSDAIRAATVLYSEGEEGIRDWIDAVDDQGYAAEVAQTRLDNLAGDWEEFTGALDTAFISMGEGANGPLRSLIQGLTELVDGFNDLPDWAQTTAMWIGTLAGAAALAGGAYLLAVPKIAEFKDAFQALGTTAQRTGRILGNVAKGVGIAAVIAVAKTGVDALAQSIASNFEPSAEELKNQFVGATSAAEQMQVALTAIGGDQWNKISVGEESVKRLREAILDAKKANDDFFYRGDAKYDYDIEALQRLGEQYQELAKTDLPQAQSNFTELASAAGLSGDEISYLLEQMPAYRDELLSQASASGEVLEGQNLVNRALGESTGAALESSEAAKTAAEAYLEQGDAAAELTDQVSELIDNLFELNGANRDAVSANSDYEQSLADAREQIANIQAQNEGFAAGLDRTTQAGRDNTAILLDIAEKTEDYARAQYELDGSTEGLTQRVNDGRQAFIDTAIELGATADEAQILADKFLGMPETAITEIIADTSKAAADIDYLTRPRTMQIFAEARANGTYGDMLLGSAGYSTGGPVNGPGTGTSDSVPAMLSNGEHVLTAAEVAAAGGHDAISQWRSGLLSPSRAGSWVPPSASGGASVHSSPGNSYDTKIYVTGQPGMNEDQIATKTAQKLNRALR